MDSSMYLIILVIAIAIQLFIIYCISSINTNANQIKKSISRKDKLTYNITEAYIKGDKEKLTFLLIDLFILKIETLDINSSFEKQLENQKNKFSKVFDELGLEQPDWDKFCKNRLSLNKISSILNH